MTWIDFTEIPPANAAGKSDEFELFARAFLEALGLRTIAGPSRGPDGGRDLLVDEDRGGALSKDTTRWLVSCKHFARSHRAVGVDDEPSIRDRVEQHGAKGFIGFYSTVPSSGLEERLNKLAIGHRVFDRESIEAKLLSEDPRLREVFARYFPKSYANFRKDSKDSGSRPRHARTSQV